MRPGDFFGEYTLHARIGEGASAEIWRASSVNMGEVILKMIRPSIYAHRPDAFDVLRRAFNGLHGLVHPTIEVGIDIARSAEDGRFALVSPYVQAETFDTLEIKTHGSGPFPPESIAEILRLIEDLAHTLNWLHRQGIVHGNVKPSNVMIVPSADGHRIRLLDLTWSVAGLASALPDQVRFIPPEQRRETVPPTPWCDQWAVAKLLSHVFVKSAQSVPAATALRKAPNFLLRIMKRALEDQPALRFGSMQAFIEAVADTREEIEVALLIPDARGNSSMIEVADDLLLFEPSSRSEPPADPRLSAPPRTGIPSSAQARPAPESSPGAQTHTHPRSQPPTPTTLPSANPAPVRTQNDVAATMRSLRPEIAGTDTQDATKPAMSAPRWNKDLPSLVPGISPGRIIRPAPMGTGAGASTAPNTGTATGQASESRTPNPRFLEEDPTDPSGQIPALNEPSTPISASRDESRSMAMLEAATPSQPFEDRETSAASLPVAARSSGLGRAQHDEDAWFVGPLDGVFDRKLSSTGVLTASALPKARDTDDNDDDNDPDLRPPPNPAVRWAVVGSIVAILGGIGFIATSTPRNQKVSIEPASETTPLAQATTPRDPVPSPAVAPTTTPPPKAEAQTHANADANASPSPSTGTSASATPDAETNTNLNATPNADTHAPGMERPTPDTPNAPAPDTSRSPTSEAGNSAPAATTAPAVEPRRSHSLPCNEQNPEACFDAAERMALAHGSPKQVRALYERACDATHARACEQLSIMWNEGLGGSANARTANAFRVRACRLGLHRACLETIDDHDGESEDEPKHDVGAP
ncbi:MAG: hypothetical protein H6729_05140 [Deltaproteobacteria bacterium]|nr:hypothetical protein [Deltaproteobacteria bacterium]